jgi:NhaP-type Na+/H+ or K+/H+ antiporter
VIDLFGAIVDFVVALLTSPGFLIGLVVGLVAGFIAWWLLRDTEARGLVSAVTFIVSTFIVGAALDGRGKR